MFGLKIIRLSRKEKQEVAVFEKTVMALNHLLFKFHEDVIDKFTLDKKRISDFKQYIFEISSLFTIYMNSKYADPIAKVNIAKIEHSLQKQIMRMDELYEQWDSEYKQYNVAKSVCEVEIEKIKSGEEVRHDNDNDDIDPALMLEALNHHWDTFINSGSKLVSSTSSGIIKNIGIMRIYIINDLIKIDMGVDLIENYKLRCKQKIPKSAERMFTLTFSADRSILDKLANNKEGD